MHHRRFDDFDPYASDYRRIHSENVRLTGADSHYFADRRIRMLRQYEQNMSMRVLDLGCGDGVMEQYIHTYFPAWQVVGIDVSAESIEMAGRLQLPGIEFRHYDGMKIPFDEGSFDIVLVAGVLHHIDFSLHADLLHEIHRVLKPGGRIIVYEHNPLNPFTRQLVKTCIFDKDARLLRRSYLRTLLFQTGFKLQQQFYFIFIPPFTWLRPLIVLEKYLGWLPIGGKYFMRAQK